MTALPGELRAVWQARQDLAARYVACDIPGPLGDAVRDTGRAIAAIPSPAVPESWAPVPRTEKCYRAAAGFMVHVRGACECKRR